MIPKNLNEIQPEDIQSLITNGVTEGRDIEYKAELPGGTDSEKKEFLADVCSLANAVGGDLLFGVEEQRVDGRPSGIPERITGVTAPNLEAEVRRLENLLRDAVAPRIHGLGFLWIDGFPNGPVLLVRVPRSWNGPHMVTYQQWSRFYTRGATGKYLMDVQQLRDTFLGAADAAARARGFRLERVGHLMGGEPAIPLEGTRLVCVHFIPYQSLLRTTVVALPALVGQGLIEPFYSQGWTYRYNADGLVSFWPGAGAVSYLQVFRNGVTESVTAGLVGEERDRVWFPSTAFGRELFRLYERHARLYAVAAIAPPVGVHVSLLNVKTVILAVERRLWIHHAEGAFDRDVLLLPDVTITDFDAAAQTVLRPVLDALWQSAGYERCFDYDENGNWIR